MRRRPVSRDSGTFIRCSPFTRCRAALEVLKMAETYLCEITGMDAMTFQPAAGAHGEFTGLLLIKAYHLNRGEEKRTKILIPDSAHGTNPASAVMAGFTVVSIPSGPDGCVDLEKLQRGGRQRKWRGLC